MPAEVTSRRDWEGLDRWIAKTCATPDRGSVLFDSHDISTSHQASTPTSWQPHQAALTEHHKSAAASCEMRSATEHLVDVARRNAHFTMAVAVSLVTLTLLVVTKPPFVCSKRKSVLDPNQSVETMSALRLMSWTALAFAIVSLSEHWSVAKDCIDSW
jgi:hypothetical protein